MFDQSPFLFWTVVTTGSRKNAQDPTIHHQLSRRIINLAFQFVKARHSPVHIVQGLVLLCAWPVPVQHLYQDTIHTISGICMQLALQIGLHVAGVGQEFARNRLQAQAHEQAHRALLWRYCLIVCQSANICDGLPPSMLLEAFQPDWAESADSTPSSNQLALRTKLHHLQISAICRIVSQAMARPDDGTLEATIEIFDSQARMLQFQLYDDVDRLTLDCVRLHICVLRFFSTQNATGLPGLVDLYAIATSLIERFSALDTSINLAQYSTFYLCRALGLATIVILKIHKSSISLPVDRERGERCYFTAIRLLRQRSSDTEDLDSRVATIMTELWTSSRIFREREGFYNPLNLRIKSRLTMSIFFDCLWWWRQEFRGEPDPFVSQGPPVIQEQLEDLRPADDPFLVFPELFPYDEHYFNIYGEHPDTLGHSHT